MAAKPHLLIVEARYYAEIADNLLKGAKMALESAGATYDVVTVPGALEIPGAISFAISASDDNGADYDGFVALGCVIRGETFHFDIVALESARGLMQLAVEDTLAIGNGILTVENQSQARVRANPDQKDKGGEAARTALAMIALRERMEG